MKQETVIVALAALAHPVRLAAFRALVVAGPEGLVQKQLAERVGVGPTNLSFHLKELATAELVTQEQSGRYVIYRAAFDRMNGVLAYLTENCCEGTACAIEQSAAACLC